MNLHASDPAFFQPGKRKAENIDDLLQLCERKLGLGADRRWTLVSSRMKLQKTFFEVEEASAEGSRRLIGKSSRSDKAAGAYEILRMLWSCGMRPPSRYTVVEPVAYLPERSLLVQEKAPGLQLISKLQLRTASVEDAQEAVSWLKRLQVLPVPVQPPADPRWNMDSCCAELPRALAGEEHRTERLMSAVRERMPYSGRLVPSHGDYHPMNLYLSPERVTVIDLDTFAGREPMADISYLLAQTAIMGYMTLGSFGGTADFRAALVAAIDDIDMDRISVNMGFAFLRSLHYDFCILHTKPVHLVEPFLSAAEQCVFDRDVDFGV
ncbi:MAG TPA: phosphotransferase [Bryobacteraceae bacterium]|nr:phosphotransferase [Bryobacteraceae bacterium]